MHSIKNGRDFPGGPVVKTLHFHCRGTKISQAARSKKKKGKNTTWEFFKVHKWKQFRALNEKQQQHKKKQPSIFKMGGRGNLFQTYVQWKRGWSRLRFYLRSRCFGLSDPALCASVNLASLHHALSDEFLITQGALLKSQHIFNLKLFSNS